MYLVILALALTAGFLVAGSGVLLPSLVLAALIGAGVTAGPVMSAERLAGFRPSWCSFPSLALAVHTLSILTLGAIVLAGIVI